MIVCIHCDHRNLTFFCVQGHLTRVDLQRYFRCSVGFSTDILMFIYVSTMRTMHCTSVAIHPSSSKVMIHESKDDRVTITKVIVVYHCPSPFPRVPLQYFSSLNICIDIDIMIRCMLNYI